MESQFEKDLAELINKYSKENDSNTPDFILARYLNAVLDNFSAAVNEREQWYGRGPHLSDIALGFPDEQTDTGQPPVQFPGTTSSLDSNPDIDLDSNYLIDLNSDPDPDLKS